LIEPLEENRPLLEQVAKKIPGAEYIMAVADARPRERTLNVHSDLVGSSLYLEKEANLDGTPRNVPSVTLDYICKDRNASEPYLIKIDVRGAELDVLSGAKEILDRTEYLILEVSLFQFVKGGPQFYDVVVFMKSHGYFVYDMFGYHCRPLDGAMA
jgi:FkbM family methyltransferase